MDTKLRIASYNVFWGSVFPQDNGDPPSLAGKFKPMDRTSNFIRIHNALRPDIWALQEVLYSREERETKTLQGHLDYFNKATSEDWNVAADVRGRLVFSRYPIIWEKSIALRMFAVLIDLPDFISKEDLLMVNVHLHWNNPEERAKEARLVVDFLKDVKQGRIIEVPSTAMLMVSGDFNDSLNSLPYKVISSLNPDIKLTETYEPILMDKQPVQFQGNKAISAGSTVFNGDSITVRGGTIDFILFSEEKLKMSNGFILNTLILNQETLDMYGLQRNDVALKPSQPLEGEVSFDHLPLVVDFSN